jgi:sec-independent protein translocase protein TatA
MGFGGISMWQMIIVLVIILLLFGTKKLRNIGGDLGSAVKGFKKAMSPEENKTTDTTAMPDDKHLDVDKKAEPQSKESSAQSTKENN